MDPISVEDLESSVRVTSLGFGEWEPTNATGFGGVIDPISVEDDESSVRVTSLGLETWEPLYATGAGGAIGLSSGTDMVRKVLQREELESRLNGRRRANNLTGMMPSPKARACGYEE